jgi:dipeptidyl aminopeptidase/acylaminoacyl peptidase
METVDYEHFGRFVCPCNLLARGRELYYIAKRVDFEDNGYKSDLFVLKDGQQKQLTNSGDVMDYYLLDNCIAFASLRSEKDREDVRGGKPLTVIYALDYDGGEAREMIRIDLQVTAMRFIDSDRFFFTGMYSHALAAAFAESGGDLSEAVTLLRADSDYRVIDEIPFWQNGTGYISKTRRRLYYCDSGQIRPVIGEFTDVVNMALSPDKKTLAFASCTYSDKRPPYEKLHMLDTSSFEAADISLSGRSTYSALDFIGDSDLIIQCCRHDKYGLNQNPDIYRCNTLARKSSCVYSGGEHSMANSIISDIKAARTIAPQPMFYKNSYYFISTVDDSAHIMKLALDGGGITPLTSKRGSVEEAVMYDGGFAAIALRDMKGAEIYRIDKKGNETPLSELNPHCAEYDAAAPSGISFENKRGVRIHGFALAPAGMKTGVKYPAILNIHGGPKMTYGPVYVHEMQLWAAMGYAVIFCNPSGSDGRGNEFADIRGQYGAADYDDIMEFVDRCLVRFDYIDPGRVGVTGGSYGGFMTNWIIGHTDRFAAAASQRGISNWISFTTMSDIGVPFGSDQCDATPWSDIDAVWDMSPLKYANHAKTPTLFIHSDEDYRCPMPEGLQMFTALRYHGVPSRLVLFRGENHELSRSGRPKHRVRRLKEITGWFERYLKPEE